MTRMGVCLMVCGIAPLLSGCWEPDYCDPERIVFEDANLEEAVRDELFLRGEDITKEDIEGLQRLTAIGESIRSLRGLECAAGLQDVNLDDNPIEDLAPLAELPALSNLSLSRVMVHDWNPLRTLTQLISLDVSTESFGDTELPMVLGMPLLVDLDVSRSSVTSLTPLGAHAGLQTLGAAGNRLTDDALAEDGLTLATATAIRRLNLSDNAIKGLNPAALPPGLVSLQLNHNAMTSTAILGRLTALTTLDLSNNELLLTTTDLGVLHELVTLNLASTRVRDLAPLTGHPQLFDLDLTGVDFDCRAQSEHVETLRKTIVETNGGTFTMHCEQDCAGTWGGGAVEDLCGICDDDPNNDHRVVDPALAAHLAAITGMQEPTFEAIQGITTLSMDNAGIESISGLECFVALEQLSLFGNRVADLSPVSGLEHLHYLNLGNNLVYDVRELSILTSLQRLNLRANAVQDLLPLEGLTGLTWLDLSQNQVQDVASLAPLIALRDLDLGENFIADVSPLSSLVALETLDIGENDVANLEPISVLTTLLGLEAQGNAIVDPSPLLMNTMLAWLDLGSNPFVCEDPATRTALRDLGEMVVLHNDGTISHDCL